MDKNDPTIITSKSEWRTRQVTILLIVILLTLSCLSTPPKISRGTQNPEPQVTQRPTAPSFPKEFTTKIGDFRFYVLNASRIGLIQAINQTYNANEGFEFLSVNLIIENLSDQPLQMYPLVFTAKGNTSSGEYTYSQTLINYAFYNGIFSPHFRIRNTIVFEVAKNVTNIKLTIEARNQRENLTGEITIPDIGIDNAIELPYSTDKVNLLTKTGNDFVWIQGIPCKIIDVARVASGLQLTIEITNPTGYDIKPFELFSGATILDKSGIAYPLVSREVDINSVPPALTKTAKYYMDFSLPQNASESVLFLQGNSNEENKWINLDISNASYIWKLLRVINAGDKDNVSISWSPDSQRIVFSQTDGYSVGNIQIVDTDTGALIYSFPDHEVARSVAWSPDGSSIAVGSQSQIRLYDATNFTLRKRMSSEEDSPYGYVSVLGWSPDSTKLVSLMPDENALIQVWDTVSGTLIKSFGISDYSVYNNDIYTNGAWSLDGKYFAVGRHQSTGPIQIYETSNWEIVKKINGTTTSRCGPDRSNRSVSWSPDGKFLAIGGFLFGYISDCSSFSIVNFETGGKEDVEMPKSVLDIEWIHRGKRLAVVSKDNSVCRVYIWEVSSKQFSYILPCIQKYDNLMNISWSPDNSKLAIGDGDGSIYIWEFSTQELLP